MAELAEKALDQAINGGGEVSSPTERQALAIAARRMRESEAEAAELRAASERDREIAARSNSSRARTFRELLRVLTLLFGVVGGAIGLWTASFWVPGFTLPNNGGKFLALAICAAVLNATSFAVIVGTIKASVWGAESMKSLIVEEQMRSWGKPTRRNPLRRLLLGAAMALPFFALAAEVIWLAPASLRLGGWISGLAAFPVGLPSGWGGVLVTLFETVGVTIVGAIARARTPNHEVHEVKGPGYMQRVEYRKFGPFRLRTEHRQGRDIDFF
ncbi:hypothetical protein [Kitasatospora terrestris]|uniref:Uncharacterized protein n=1 Tax=Kitasatospora terrestris TaxID=258051 RepID=A0ABP9ESH2_9ACTN